MTSEQYKALMEACKNSDDVRIVTLALQIAATASREKRRNMAIGIREIVDHHLDAPTQIREYYRHRLEIATKAMAGLISRSVAWDPAEVAALSVRYADALMESNAKVPLPTDQRGADGG